MKGNVRKYQVKARRLLRLYSLWHETQREDLKKKCLTLLSEVLAIDPRFSLRHEFESAF